MERRTQVLPQIIAHRGASNYTPENTMESFNKAITMGAKAIELDVMLTKDLKPVIIHDNNLIRTTGINKKVSDMVYQEISTLDVGSWFDTKFSNCKISHLDHILQEFSKYSISLNLELKSFDQNFQLLAKTVLDAIDKAKFLRCDILISSYSKQTLVAVYSIQPDMALGMLLEDPIKVTKEEFTSMNYQAIIINAEKITHEYIKELQLLTNEIYAYTVNDPDIGRELIKQGIKGVYSDKPDLFSRGNDD